MATASPVAPLSNFLFSESLFTLHAEFESIPDLVTGTTPILEESILDLENENDTEDDDSDDSSSGDNISGNTISTENPSDSEGDSGSVSVQFLKAILANLKAEIETNNKPKIYSDGTFWCCPRDPVLALATSIQEGNLNPRELYHLHCQQKILQFQRTPCKIIITNDIVSIVSVTSNN